nr:MAG TPA: hypothetical protein [Bacteriophage sp.]
MKLECFILPLLSATRTILSRTVRDGPVVIAAESGRNVSRHMQSRVLQFKAIVRTSIPRCPNRENVIPP